MVSHADEEDAPLERASGCCVGEKEHERQQNQPRDLEHTQEPPTADDADGEKREQNPSDQPAEFLIGLHAADRLLLRRCAPAPRTSGRPGTMRGIC